ncbi:MAG: S-layer homology domain-containing protein [Armatimonadetes bacterium]|nr:S-layer homology domain-containing protein [Armatimonadota bacterium]
MKRMLTLSLGAAMVASVTPALGQAFPDTPENHWAYQAVLGAKAAGFLVGYPDGMFRGPRPASRYEMAAALYALYMNLKGVSDGLAAQYNALNEKIGKMGGGSTEGLATKAEVKAVMDALDALKRQMPGQGKDFTADIDALKKMTSTFEKELASQGVDVEATKKGIEDLSKRVKALEERKMPVDIHGDLNFWMGSGYGTDDETGITFDGRPTTGAENGFAKNLRMGHEASMTISGNNDNGPKWWATFVTGNLTEFDGSAIFGNQSHVLDGEGWSEPKTDFYVQNAGIQFNTSLFGQDFNATVGRVGFKAGPYFFQRPDNTPYFSNERWDNGQWIFDGAIFDFHFGSSTFTLFGGRDGGDWDNLQTSNGVPINTMMAGSAGHIFDPTTTGLDERPRGYGNHNGIMVDEHLGARFSIPLGEKGKANFNYMIFDQNGTTFIGSSTTVNRAIVFGGDFNYMFGENLSIDGGYSQSNLNSDSTNVIDGDNAAYWANLGYKGNKFSVKAGYKSIDPQFYAPGSWGRIGIWWNPTDIKGFYGSVMFDLSEKLSLGVYGAMYEGSETTINGVTGLTGDDTINHYKAHLNYKVNDAWNLMIGGEFVNWDLAARGSFDGGKPEERWYNIGLKYNMGENAWLSFLWQISDYDSKGTSGFNPFFSSATKAKGGFLTSQASIKY